MKKIVFIILLFVGFATVSMGQSKPTEVTPDGYFTKPVYMYVFGTTADTITDADNTSFVWRVKGNYTQDFNLQLYTDFVSGSASGTVITYRSIDGITYTSTGDTITFTSVTADALQPVVISLSDFNYPYLKVTYTQTGTAVVVPKVFAYTKRN